MRRLIDGEHFRYRRFATGRPTRLEIQIDRAWRLAQDAPATPLVEQMMRDFTRFCAQCMRMKFTGRGKGRIRWHLTGEPVALASQEAFSIQIGNKEVLISAGHERGLLHGTHCLERLMADRGAPWLKRGRIEPTPHFSPRI